MSNFFNLNRRDLIKGLVMAVLGGLIMPFAVAVQSPDFSILTASWPQLAFLAANGAFIAGVSYIVKNLFTNDNGKIVGVI